MYNLLDLSLLYIYKGTRTDNWNTGKSYSIRGAGVVWCHTYIMSPCVWNIMAAHPTVQNKQPTGMKSLTLVNTFMIYSRSDALDIRVNSDIWGFACIHPVKSIKKKRIKYKILQQTREMYMNICLSQCK